MTRIAALLLALAAVGCGGNSSSPVAPPPSEEAVRKNLEEQKQVESDERGTPVKSGKPAKKG